VRTIRLFSPPANQPYKEWLAKENKRWSEQVRRFQSCSSLSVEVRFAEQDVSVTPVGGRAGSQLSILKAERSGLWARIATMVSGSLCAPMKS